METIISKVSTIERRKNSGRMMVSGLVGLFSLWLIYIGRDMHDLIGIVPFAMLGVSGYFFIKAFYAEMIVKKELKKGDVYTAVIVDEERTDVGYSFRQSTFS